MLPYGDSTGGTPPKAERTAHPNKTLLQIRACLENNYLLPEINERESKFTKIFLYLNKVNVIS